jgi:ribonuclease VapC
VSGSRGQSVLDASALLALMNDEPGADRVEEAVRDGALISAVNWAEVLTRLVHAGGDPVEAAARALQQGGDNLRLVPFDDEQARETARLAVKTRSLGLSLGDRAALALARLRGLPALTSDTAWRSLRLSIRIEIIR